MYHDRKEFEEAICNATYETEFCTLYCVPVPRICIKSLVLAK
jgi:hypothetical protein